jgi:predicted dehydrogenase
MGMMGRTHFEAYQALPGVRVRAICDRNPHRASGDLVGTEGNVLGAGIQRLDMTGIIGTTNSAELFANSELDVLDICTATPSHVELATAALATGKHVLCEKPLARTSVDARRICSAAQKAQGLFMTAMCLRFWPEWAWLKAAVSEEKFGPVLSATFHRLTSMPAGWYKNGELSGGALLDLHIHDTDFVEYLFGMPRAVYSRGYSKTSGAVDHVCTQYIYDPGQGPPLVTAEGTWALAEGFGFQMKYVVNCERATMTYDLARAPTLLVHANGQATEIAVANENGYLAELRYFLDCVRTGKRPEIVRLDDPVRCLQILEAEERSVHSGAIELVTQPE